MEPALTITSWENSERDRGPDISFNGRSDMKKKRELLLVKFNESSGGANGETINVYQLDNLDVMEYEQLVNNKDTETKRVSSLEFWELLNGQIDEELEQVNE